MRRAGRKDGRKKGKGNKLIKKDRTKNVVGAQWPMFAQVPHAARHDFDQFHDLRTGVRIPSHPPCVLLTVSLP